MQVLVAEDEPMLRLMLTTSLARAGYEVTAAPDGTAALRLLDDGVAPDALITDIRMPGADGWTVARAYRSRFPDLPVLYITGFTDHSDAVPGGVVLPKPFRIAKLLAALAALQQSGPSPSAVEGYEAEHKQALHGGDRLMRVHLPDGSVREMTLCVYQEFLASDRLAEFSAGQTPR